MMVEEGMDGFDITIGVCVFRTNLADIVYSGGKWKSVGEKKEGERRVSAMGGEIE